MTIEKECYEEDVQPYRKRDYKPIIIIVKILHTISYSIKKIFLQLINPLTIMFFLLTRSQRMSFSAKITKMKIVYKQPYYNTE